MSTPNSKISEQIGFLTTIDPIALTAGNTVTSTWVDLSNYNGSAFEKYLPVIQVGAGIGTNSVIASVMKASNVSGTGAATLMSTSITSTNGFVQPFDLNGMTFNTSDTLNTFVALRVTTVLGTTVVSGALIAGEADYQPATQWNVSKVASAANIPAT